MSLEEIKQDYAEDEGYNNFEEMMDLSPHSWRYDEVSERYAKNKVNEALDKAVEEAKLVLFNFVGTSWLKSTYEQFSINDIAYLTIDKESILKLKNNEK